MEGQEKPFLKRNANVKPNEQTIMVDREFKRLLSFLGVSISAFPDLCSLISRISHILMRMNIGNIRLISFSLWIADKKVEINIKQHRLRYPSRNIPTSESTLRDGKYSFNTDLKECPSK